MKLSAMIGEVVRTATAQRVSSVMVAVLCGAVCAVTLLTVGRTVAAERQVLDRLDDAGSRLLVVTDDRDAGLISPAVLDVMGGLDTTDRVVGVDAPFDVTNAVIGDGGTRVPAWRIAGGLDQAVTVTAGRWPRTGEALVAREGQEELGLAHPAGAVVDDAGRRYDVVGSFDTRSPFGDLAAGVVVAGGGQGPARSMYVVVDGVEAARVTERLALATLAPRDPRHVTVQSPTALADLQQAVSGDFGEFGRGILLLTLGGGAFLVTAVVLAEVLLRRRDLGRRRALGASRRELVVLVVGRTVVAAAPGAVAGVASGLAVAAATSGTPPVDFAVATAVLAVFAAGMAALVPAVLAARRDPVAVLRTP